MAQYVLGIALEPDSVTFVRLRGNAKAHEVVLAVRQPLPQAPDPDEQFTLQQQALQFLITEHRLRSDTALVALPAHQAIIRNLTLPFKDGRRLHQTIKFALDEHMPFEPEDVVVDFSPFASLAGQTRLLAAAVPQEVIGHTLDLLHSVALEPTVIDLDVFGLANALVLGGPRLPSRTVLMDRRPDRTLMTLLEANKPIFARSLVHSCSSDESPIAAEDSHLSKSLQHTLYACEHLLQQSYTPDLIVLSGSAEESLEQLATTLQADLEVATSVWRLPGARNSAVIEPIQHTIAFGMALRGLHRHAVGLNLRRDQFALHSDLQELRGRFVGLGLLLVAVCGMWLGNLYLDTHHKQQRYDQIQREIARVFRSTLPGSRMVQPVFQMREQIRQLEERLQAFGGVAGAQLSGLQLLREISAQIPTSVTIEVDNMTITTDTIDISGSTASYDDVVKLKDALAASPFLGQVKINNSRQNLTNKVDFKLTIKTVQPEAGTS